MPRAPEPPLQERVRAAFAAAVRACDPEPLVRDALRGVRRFDAVVAIGKAAAAMARGVPRPRAGGVCVVPRGQAEAAKAPRWIDVVEGGHPHPDKWSFQAGRRILRLLDEEATYGNVLVLLSGGASALAVFPGRRITIGEYDDLTRRLLASGLPIQDVNCVRRHVDALKGGRLAALHFVRTVTLALSDVVGDDPPAIGSGPTVPDPTTCADAAAILRRAGLARYVRCLDETPKAIQFDWPVDFRVIGNHETLARAAARALRVPARTGVVGPVGELARRYAHLLARGESLAAAGEPTIALPARPALLGKGRARKPRGGRAQHLALLVSRAIAGRADVCFLSAGSDGVDGTTDAAGAVVTGETWPEAERRGLAPARALRGYDAYPVFAALGALVRTGPTGTNVGDLHLLLARRERKRKRKR